MVMRPPSENPPSWLDHLDPRAKILGCTLLAVAIVATPNRALWALALFALPVSFLLGLARLPWKALGRRYLALLPLIALLAGVSVLSRLLPGVSWTPGGLPAWVTVAAVGGKAFLALTSFVVLVTRTPFVDLMWGLHQLRLPGLLLLIVESLYRWLDTLTGELNRMRRALVARNYRARWLGDVPFLGHALGSLFLRTYARSERVHMAMLSRGYSGSMPRTAADTPRPLFQPRDTLFVAGAACTGIVVVAGALVAG